MTAQDAVLQALQFWIDRIESGDSNVDAVAFITVSPTGGIATSYAGSSVHHHNLISGTAILQHRLTSDYEKELEAGTEDDSDEPDSAVH